MAAPFPLSTAAALAGAGVAQGHGAPTQWTEMLGLEDAPWAPWVGCGSRGPQLDTDRNEARLGLWELSWG